MIIASLKKAFKTVYIQLFKIDDGAQRIALGFGLGIFLGILPGTGPIAALFCALFLRVNRAATLIGALITNTWLSIVTFLLAIKIGSAITGMDWQLIRDQLTALTKTFSWASIFKLSALEIMLPLALGYAIIGFSLGFMAYLITLIIIRMRSKDVTG